MSVDSSQMWGERFKSFSRVLGIIIIAWAILVIVGWCFGIPLLTSVIPQGKAMSPLSSVLFLVAGLSLSLRVSFKPDRQWARRLAFGLGAGIVVLGLIRLMEDLFCWGGLQSWLFAGMSRMASPTAIALILLGLALCVMGFDIRRRVRVIQLLVLVPMLISALVLIGYGYRIHPLHAAGSSGVVSLPTAVLLMCLSLGILFADPNMGVMGLLSRDTGTGKMVRHLLVASIAMVSILGWIRLEGERCGWFNSEVGFALFMLVTIVILSVLIFRNAGRLAMAECEQAGMDAALHRAHDELEHRVAERTRDLANVIAELSEGISLLSNVGGDVMAASNQVSVCASETATAVEQTAVTVEEVRQTVRMTSQDSGQVAESALKAAQISLEGRKSTDETIAIMQRIRQEMDAISESMMRLNDQSQAIGQIIATVNSLAAQSNLLAVNAAIEASKAGERGKGFAVVAQEVKMLADQSRRATHQVGVILNDIQKATHQSVMAIEHGRQAVGMGVNQSEQTGGGIEMLAASVGQAAEAAGHIANASQQQLVGVDQVVAAMACIRHGTAHSLASSRQLEVAAQHLKDLAQKLKQLVTHYKGP